MSDDILDDILDNKKGVYWDQFFLDFGEKSGLSCREERVSFGGGFYDECRGRSVYAATEFVRSCCAGVGQQYWVFFDE